jgi:hypothetical protein
MSKERIKKCPKCGRDASAEAGHGAMHTGHMLHQGMHSGSPLLIGLTLLGAVGMGIKQHRFKCRSCGHAFIGW